MLTKRQGGLSPAVAGPSVQPRNSVLSVNRFMSPDTLNSDNQALGVAVAWSGEMGGVKVPSD